MLGSLGDARVACRGPGLKRGGRAVFAFCASRPRSLLLLLVSILLAGPASAVSSGQPLSQALEELRRAGLPLIFSSGLIDPGMTVTVDPGPGTPEEVARRILAPHGLTLEQIRPQLFAVVKAPPTPPAKDTAQSNPENQPPARDAEVDIYASRYGVDPAQTVPRPSTDISRQELETMPALFQDAMRAMRIMPGTATSAISARPHIRGGREDELATYFDGVPLFEPYHYKDVQALLGTLDPETISTMNLFSGVFPPRYGNRLSGVLDMQPRTWGGDNYYALSQSLLYTEGLSQGRLDSAPLQWLGAVRVGVVDLITNLLDRNQVDPDFMDALGRIQYDLSDRSRIAVGYLLLDDSMKATFDSSFNAVTPPPLSSIEQAQVHYRDGTVWLGWTWLPGERATVHTTVSRTERHTLRFGTLNREGSSISSLDDGRHFGTSTLRIEGSDNLTAQWRLNGGLEFYDYDALYNFTSNSVFEPHLAGAFGRPDRVSRLTNLRVDGQGYAAYASLLRSFESGFAIDVGLRWDGERYGPAFEANQLSPRLSLQYRVSPDTVLRASVGRLSQTQRPDELQVEDGDNVFHRAEFAMQSVLSVEQRLTARVQLHLEAFDKQISHPRPRFENLMDPIALLPEIEVDRVRIQPSSSRALGAEFSLRWSTAEHWAGWVNYSRSEVTDVINSEVVPRSWDQKNAAAAGVAWRGSPWLLSANVNWHTGWRRNRLRVVGFEPLVFGLVELNSRNWPDYFSLDTRATWTHSLPKGSIELFGEIDNATNHANPCCTDVQFQQEQMARPLFERTTSLWLPRFALVGATWKLP
jgi:TonB dependent receptor/TonB-dependent Receptor Plug Domain